MHIHWINENRISDKIVGSIFWAGRGWLYLNDEGGYKQKQIGIEWYFGSRAHHTTLEVRTDFVMDRELHFSIGLYGLFCFFLSLAFPGFPSWNHEHGDRQIGVRFFDGALWLDLWRNDDNWRSNDWRTRPIVIRPVDILFGRMKHSDQKLSDHEATVSLPDGQYPVKIEMTLVKLKRPRWPFATHFKRARIELLKPIPIPGKGENSWDIDDDAIMSMTCNVETVEQAIAKVVESALRDRRRYGGSLEWSADQ